MLDGRKAVVQQVGERFAGATLADAAKAGAVTINYGLFLNALISFVIVAFVLFLVVRSVNRLFSNPPDAAPAAPPEDVLLLREIRDLLKAKD